MARHSLLPLVALSLLGLSRLPLAAQPAQPASAPAPAAASQPASQPASRPGRALTEAQEAELMAFLRQTDPVLVKQLEEMQKNAPGQAEAALHRLWRIYQTVRNYPPEVRTAALSRHRINVQVFRTLRDLRQCKDDAARAPLMERLRELLNQLFDSEQVVREYEIQRLATQLEQLKNDVDERRQHRQEHVLNQLDQLIRRAASQPSLNAVEETLK